RGRSRGRRRAAVGASHARGGTPLAHGRRVHGPVRPVQLPAGAEHRQHVDRRGGPLPRSAGRADRAGRDPHAAARRRPRPRAAVRPLRSPAGHRRAAERGGRRGGRPGAGHRSQDGGGTAAHRPRARLPGPGLRGSRAPALAAGAGAAHAGAAERAGGLAASRVSPLVTIALRFMILSLIAVGGVTTIIPEVHRIVVDVHHWVSDAEFTQLFVIARAAPGPNMLLVTLIGWKVGGLPGALV